MVDVQSVFDKYDINPYGSLNRAIIQVSNMIEDSQDPLAKSNQIIKQLGCTPLSCNIEAPIIAKCLIEQAILMKADYTPEFAFKRAEQKLADLKAKHPSIFVMKEKQLEATANKPANDKKARALAIFEANRGKKPSDIAKLIQVELGITFANAYYYVSRVFK